AAPRHMPQALAPIRMRTSHSQTQEKNSLVFPTNYFSARVNYNHAIFLNRSSATGHSPSDVMHTGNIDDIVYQECRPSPRSEPLRNPGWAPPAKGRGGANCPPPYQARRTRQYCGRTHPPRTPANRVAWITSRPGRTIGLRGPK